MSLKPKTESREVPLSLLMKEMNEVFVCYYYYYYYYYHHHHHHHYYYYYYLQSVVVRCLTCP